MDRGSILRTSEVFFYFLCATAVYACLLCAVSPLHGFSVSVFCWAFFFSRRPWLVPVPYSNKEGSFRWGFCKINGAVLKCTFFAWPASTLHRTPTRRALSVGAFVKKVRFFQKCDLFAWPACGHRCVAGLGVGSPCTTKNRFLFGKRRSEYEQKVYILFL
jgi:hypothetical protein